MEIPRPAVAGTLESSDVLVTIEPRTDGIELLLTSPVVHQFGKAIKATVIETLHNLGVANARITVVDNGALDCTLRARVEGAVYRANGIAKDIPWGGAVK